MAKNDNLRKAKEAKNDEFYTQIGDIEKELKHYKEHFKGKTVFCNCDDPEWSNFWKYFHLNFGLLGLKKLVTTHYDASEPTFKMEYEGGNDSDTSVGVITPLKQNGDFRSPECIELLQKADIVVTNPPFSLFREYMAVLMEHQKKFIVIGNLNAIAYKDFFPLLRDNKVWMGYGGNIPMTFRMPDYYELRGSAFIGDDGHKYTKMGSCSWYTNLDIQKRHEKLILWKKYSPEEFPKYDNYDAINVDKVSDIPVDYEYELIVDENKLKELRDKGFDIEIIEEVLI